MTIGRPITLPEPLKGLAKQAGGIAQLQAAMGGIPRSTLSRWGYWIKISHKLPRSAVDAIQRAETKLKRKRK